MYLESRVIVLSMYQRQRYWSADGPAERLVTPRGSAFLFCICKQQIFSRSSSYSFKGRGMYLGGHMNTNYNRIGFA